MLVALKSLPVMKIESVKADGFSLTPSLSRIAGPQLGLCYPSLDRRVMKNEMETLPYISNASVSYDGGRLLLDLEKKEGAVILSGSEAFFYADSEIHPVAMEDVPSLGSYYSIINIDGEYSDEVKTYLDSVLPSLFSSRLITWIDCVNNNEVGPIVLRIALPRLNSILMLSEPSGAARLGESVEAIEDDVRKNPGSTIFSEPSVYELYSNRLVRNKR